MALASVPLPVAEGQAKESPATPRHMPEEIRSTVDKLVVIAGEAPAARDVSGTYEKATSGLVGGMDAGARATTISKDIGGVPIDFPIPVLTMPARIIGGIAGVSQSEIQEFRDALTDDLVQAGDQALTNHGFASEVYFTLQKVPGLETRIFAPTTPVPEETDAIMYVNVHAMTIDVQGKEAILTTEAHVTLHRFNDNRSLYQAVIRYRDRDTLGHWTEDGNRLWHDYVNFARHYLGREISALTFDQVNFDHELQPLKTDTVAPVKRNVWQGVTRSTTPSLAWQHDFEGSDEYGSWPAEIDESNTYFDVEVYTTRGIVYEEQGVPDTFHTLLYELEPCQAYRWSVRPAYHVGGTVRYGEWMRQEPDGNADEEDGNASGGIAVTGRKASEAPAYIQDFAAFEIKCGRR